MMLKTADGTGVTSPEAWEAVLNRDRTQDGHFVYAVKTTGIYCRPSCAARRPRPENVEFFPTSSEAERSGFRSCRRCRPTGESLEQRLAWSVAKACRAIETAEEPPTLADLAEAAGMSRFHFHRVFKAVAGVTPKAYADAHRARRVRDELTRSGTITEAIYGAGFNSNGRFYSVSSALLGMTPTIFRAGGAGMSIRFAVGKCRLGSILVAITDKGACAILLGDEPGALARDLESLFPNARLIPGSERFRWRLARVVKLLETPTAGLDLPPEVRSTAFRRRVWQALQGRRTASRDNRTLVRDSAWNPERQTIR